MTTATSTPARGGTLDDFLPAADIVPVPPLTDADWDAIRRVAGRRLVWQFCTLRNLWTHRGDFTADAFGFAWGGHLPLAARRLDRHDVVPQRGPLPLR